MTEPKGEARTRAIERLRKHAALLASAFDLPLHSIEPESERVRRRYGICFADGRIRIRLHQLRSTDVLKYSVMVDTLCHELAHLRHFNHGQRFWKLYRHIRAYAERQGIYRPGPETAIAPPTPFRSLPTAIQRSAARSAPRPAPAQLDLFAEDPASPARSEAKPSEGGRRVAAHAPYTAKTYASRTLSYSSREFGPAFTSTSMCSSAIALSRTWVTSELTVSSSNSASASSKADSSTESLT